MLSIISLAKYSINTSITCRLIKVIFTDGSKEIQCTSLLDAKEYPLREFAALYHYCWSKEEAYKLLKKESCGVGRLFGKNRHICQAGFFCQDILDVFVCYLRFPDRGESQERM